MKPGKFLFIGTCLSVLSFLDFLSYASATVHVNKCDNRCVLSGDTSQGNSHSCSQCCNIQGFSRGGECGDYLARHCRCWEEPAISTGHIVYPQQHYPQHYPGFGAYASNASHQAAKTD